MKLTRYRLFSVLTILALFLGACGTAATPDAAAIATSAVQTVEARYTEQALLQPTDTPAPSEVPATVTPEPTQTPKVQVTQSTPEATAQRPQKDPVTPCLLANYVADVTIPDYAMVTPGEKFTKTWRVKNSGSCPWDAGYKLVFDSGNSMGDTTSFSLPQVVYEDQTVDISIEFTAPATEGVYTGYWRLATPFGGTIGFGQYDAPLSVVITSAANPKKGFQVVEVTYDPLVRSPKTGCPEAGTSYTFTAHITTNGEGDVTYHWERSPNDEDPPIGDNLTYKAAGTKTVTWTWLIKPGLPNPDRWVAIYIDEPNMELFPKVFFNTSCE